MRWIVVFLLIFSVSGRAGAGDAKVDPLEDPEVLGEMAEPDTAMYKYLKARRLKCTSEWFELATPVELTINGRAYEYSGPVLKAKKRTNHSRSCPGDLLFRSIRRDLLA